MDHFFNPFFMKEDITINQYFKKMVDDISNLSNMASDLIKKTTETAIATWEKVRQEDVSNIFLMTPEERANQVNQILKFFSEKIEKLLPSKKLVEVSSIIAKKNLNNLFQI
jgi:hypothetical protein